MIRIGKMTDYGIVLLSYFASHPDTKAFTARDLAVEAKLPLPTVSKILKTLCRGELLLSHRGVNGGYRLGQPADQISIAKIIEVLEGPIALTECSSHHSDAADNCGLELHCPVMNNWQKISITVRRALEQLTLKDMVLPFGAGATLGLVARVAEGNRR
jgi:FeS assembly SUF system regulator